MKIRSAPPIVLALLAGTGCTWVTGCEQSSSPDRVASPGSTEAEGVTESDARFEPEAPDQSPSDTSDLAESVPAPGTARAPGDARLYAGNLSFALPEGWEARPPSNPMRAAEAAAPGSGGAPGPVAAFSLAGGSVDANITRWAGQFAESDATQSRETREINGRTVHLVEMKGSYRGMGGPVQANTTMLAAIIEQPGQPSVFVKMTGPSESVDAARDAWDTMIDSLSSP